jgi:phosphonate transport system ATP-binding protein
VTLAALDRPVSVPAQGTETAQPMVVVRALAKRFETTTVLRDATFAVHAGERVALIGANGTGKSTLLRCLIRLVEPDDGAIRVLGADVRTLSGHDLRRFRARIGFVFQRHNLVPRFSALSNVVHGALSRGGARLWHQALAPSGIRSEALACLERVGLGDIALRRADRLSGGQSQRTAIARMLMQRPELLIADEPVASLDPKAGEEVMEMFASLVRERGDTLLFTTHDMAHALGYAERIIGLEGGRVALDAPADAVTRADLRSFFT